MQIDFADETGKLTAEQMQLVEKVLLHTANKESVASHAEMSVNFVHDEEIQEINKTYRDKDEPTDVISFAMQEEGEGEVVIQGADLPIMLGDVIISVERAEAQATEYNHSFERELAFLAVHGLLHLLGYDHLTEAEEKIMFAKQEEILSELGIER